MYKHSGRGLPAQHNCHYGTVDPWRRGRVKSALHRMERASWRRRTLHERAQVAGLHNYAGVSRGPDHV